MDEKSPSLEELLKTFTPTQLDFVALRMFAKNDKEAAEALDISPDVVYNWDNKQDVNLAVQMAKMDGVSVAREKLIRLATKAVDKLGDKLDGKNSSLGAIFGVLDRVGLPARAEITGDKGGPVLFRVVQDDE